MLYSAVALILLFFLTPMLLITLASLTTTEEIYQWPRPIVPSKFSFESIATFLGTHGIISSLMNSIIVALLTVALSLVIGAPAGYAIARFKFRGRGAFRVGILITRMFPIMILSIPLITLYIRLGIYDTLLGVSVIHTVLALPFVVLMTSAIFASIPIEMEEAAMILGCSRFKSFIKVALPMALPGLAAAAMFAFIVSWNEVFAATVLTLTNPTITAKVLTSLIAVAPLEFKFASGFLLLVPAVVYIFIVRRYLITTWGITIK